MESIVNPWEVRGEIDYEKLMQEFGVEKFTEKPDHLLFSRNIIYGQRDFSKIMDCIKKKEKFVLLTGLMPSGKFHFGHMLVAQQIIFYQSLGAKVYVCVADIEAYNTRIANLEELRKIALEEYLTNYIALGLKPTNCDFYFQSERSRIADKSNKYYSFASMVGRHVTQNEIKSIYGEISPAKISSALLQASDILHPQLIEGSIPTIVPVGFDQDPHLRLARDIVQRIPQFNFIQVSSTYHKFLPGLKGGKMSSSDSTSFIALTDSPEVAREKIMKHAFSGGRNSLEEHRKLGGIPEIDVSFQYLKFLLEPNDKKLAKLEEEYKSGKLLTGELKDYAIKLLTKFLEKHQTAREKAKSKLDKFLKN